VLSGRYRARLRFMITGGIAARHPKAPHRFSHGGGAMSVLLPAWCMLEDDTEAKESLAESPATRHGASTTTAGVRSRGGEVRHRSFGATQICVGRIIRLRWATSTRSARWKKPASTATPSPDQFNQREALSGWLRPQIAQHVADRPGQHRVGRLVERVGWALTMTTLAPPSRHLDGPAIG